MLRYCNLAQKECIIFRPSTKTKAAIKIEPEGVFDSVFSSGKLRSSSLRYFPVFVVFYLKLFENIDKMSESRFFSCYFIEMKLMNSCF